MLKEFFRNKFTMFLTAVGISIVLVTFTFMGISLSSNSCLPEKDSGIQSTMSTNAIGFTTCPASEHFIFGG